MSEEGRTNYKLISVSDQIQVILHTALQYLFIPSVVSKLQANCRTMKINNNVTIDGSYKLLWWKQPDAYKNYQVYS